MEYLHKVNKPRMSTHIKQKATQSIQFMDNSQLTLKIVIQVYMYV